MDEMTSISNSKSNELVHSYTLNDVLLGRGKNINAHEGNVNFRKIVRGRWKDYHTGVKSLVASQIADEVQAHGGRFLRNVSSFPTYAKGKVITKEAWEVVGTTVVTQKIKQAFRDLHAIRRKQAAAEERTRWATSLAEAQESDSQSANSTLKKSLATNFRQRQEDDAYAFTAAAVVPKSVDHLEALKSARIRARLNNVGMSHRDDVISLLNKKSFGSRFTNSHLRQQQHVGEIKQVGRPSDYLAENDLRSTSDSALLERLKFLKNLEAKTSDLRLQRDDECPQEIATRQEAVTTHQHWSSVLMAAAAAATQSAPARGAVTESPISNLLFSRALAPPPLNPIGRAASLVPSLSASEQSAICDRLKLREEQLMLQYDRILHPHK